MIRSIGLLRKHAASDRLRGEHSLKRLSIPPKWSDLRGCPGSRITLIANQQASAINDYGAAIQVKSGPVITLPVHSLKETVASGRPKRPGNVKDVRCHFDGIPLEGKGNGSPARDVDGPSAGRNRDQITAGIELHLGVEGGEDTPYMREGPAYVGVETGMIRIVRRDEDGTGKPAACVLPVTGEGG